MEKVHGMQPIFLKFLKTIFTTFGL